MPLSRGIFRGLLIAAFLGLAATAATRSGSPAHTVAEASAGVLFLALGWAWIVRDRDARRLVEKELRASEARFRGLVRDVPVGVLVQGPDARFLLANPKVLELLGLEESQLLGRTSYDPVWDIADEGGRVLAASEYPPNRAIATRGAVRDVVVGVEREGSPERIWLLVNSTPQVSEDGTLVQVVSTFQDVTERRAAERRLLQANVALQKLSLVDAVTDVANRRQFDRALADEWARAARAGEPIAVVLLDVDHFKPYNDRYGHPSGDVCLRTIASVLSRTLQRGGDILARYGGEEFAAILPQTDAKAATVVAERMRKAVEALAHPHGASELGILTVSAGVAATRPEADASALGLVARADAALYEAKVTGRNRIVTSDETGAVPVRPSRG